MRQEYDLFTAQDAVILVIGPDDANAYARQWQQQQFPFVGLPDPTHQVANRYGQEVKLLKFGRLPALMVVDKDGFVRYVHYGSSMQDIPPNAEVLAVLAQLNEE